MFSPISSFSVLPLPISPHPRYQSHISFADFYDRFRTELEDYIRREWNVPLVLVAVNGGPGTLQTVVEGVFSPSSFFLPPFPFLFKTPCCFLC